MSWGFCWESHADQIFSIVFVALIAIPIPSWFPSEKTLASRDAENLVPVDNTKYGGGYPAQQGPQYPPRPYGGNSQA